MAANIGRFIGGISFGIFADTMPLTRSLAKGRREIAMFAGAGSRMMGLFAGGLGGATLTGAIYKAGQSFETLNRSMTKSLAIMGDVSQKMRGEMKAAAIDVSRTTNASASQAADAYFYLASAGLNAEQSLAAMPQVAKFAQAGNFDLALATDLATDAQSALGLTVKDSDQNLRNMTRVTDVLTKANILANASVEQFSRALTTGAGVALKIVNKDIEEGVAVLAAFADQGIKAEEAGTAFGIVMRDLQTKAIQNKSAFAAMGISVFDASGDMRNMADIIEDLENRLVGMSDETKKATLLNLGFADKSVKFVQALLGTSDRIREYETALRGAGGATSEIANKSMTDLEKANNRLKSSFEQLSQSMGPVVAKMADAAELASLLINPNQSNSISERARATKEREGRHLLVQAEARKRFKDKQDKGFRLDEFLSNPLGELTRYQGANITPAAPKKDGLFGGIGSALTKGSNFLGNQLGNIKAADKANREASGKFIDGVISGLDEMAPSIKNWFGNAVELGKAGINAGAMGLNASNRLRLAADLDPRFRGQQKKKMVAAGEFSAAESGSLAAYQQRVRGQQQFEKVAVQQLDVQKRIADGIDTLADKMPEWGVV